jgi:hypothetical protein
MINGIELCRTDPIEYNEVVKIAVKHWKRNSKQKILWAENHRNISSKSNPFGDEKRE